MAILITVLVDIISVVTPKTIINNDILTNSKIVKARKLNKLAMRDRLKSTLPSQIKAMNNKTISKIR